MFEKLKQRQRGRGLKNPLAVRDPKIRIYVMLAAFVFVIVAMFGLDLYSKDPKNKQPELDTPSPEAPPEDDGVIGVPVLDRSLLDKIADETEDDRNWWQNDVMSYLLLEARNTPAVHDFNRNLIPIGPKNAALIAKDSKPWRGRYVRFRGEIEYLREEPYEEVYGATETEFGIVHRGRVRVEGADVRILFLSPVGPMWRDANDPVAVPRIRPIVDGWVRGRGILVKNFIDDTTGPATPVLLLVATNLERDYELRPVRGLNDVPFDDIVDDPVGANTPEGRAIMAKEFPRALYRLLKYAESRAGAAGSELRQQEKLKPRSFRQEAEYQELVGNAKAHRAEYFGALGVIALEPLHYTAGTITPNDAGVTECLNGWILTDQQKLIQFIAPGRLAGAWPKRTRIRFEGYYYKCKLYQARNGTDRLAPVFVLTVLDEIIPPPPDRTAQFAVAGLFVAGLAALFFLIMREDKTKDSFRRARRKRRTVA